MSDTNKKTAATITKNFTELNNKEYKRMDLVLTIASSISFFCLGMLTQYELHRKDVSKFFKKTSAELDNVEDNTPSTDDTERGFDNVEEK